MEFGSLSRRAFVGFGASLAAAGALSFLSAASPADAQTTTTSTRTASTGTARPHGRRGPGFGRGAAGPDLQAIATALKLTPTQLRQQLQAGKSIAQVAQAQNVPLQTVKDAIVAAARTRLDQAVAAGRISSAQETQQITSLQGRLDQLLNATPRLHSGGAHPAGNRTRRQARSSA